MKTINMITRIIEILCAFLIYGAVGAMEIQSASDKTCLILIAVYIAVGATAHIVRHKVRGTR